MACGLGAASGRGGFGGRPARARRGFESFERAGGEDLGETSDPRRGFVSYFGSVMWSC